MKKPVYLLPFIFVYRFFKILFLWIYKFIKYILYGIIYSFILIGRYSSKVFQYIVYGLIVFSFVLYKFLKYLVFGFYFPFVFVGEKYRKINEKQLKQHEQKVLEKEKKKVEKKLERQREAERKVIEKAEIAKKKKELKEQKKEEKKKRKDKDEYKNENVSIEKQDFSYKINQFFTYFGTLPSRIKEGMINWYNNLTFVKNKKNRYEMEHQQLLISFDGEDAIKSVEKIPYEYVVKDENGKIIKGHYEAFSKVEVHSFLLSENYEVYSIKTSKWIQLKYGHTKTSNAKFKTKDLIFFLTQLSTYIKSGITLIESLKILTRQYKKQKYKQTLKNVVYELTMGGTFSEALEKQGKAFPKLLINMIKTSEMTGELPEALDDMEKYYTEADKTRRQMITAMMYPTIVFVIATAVIIFVLMFVVPQFTDIYSTMEGVEVPAFTQMVMNVSNYIKANIFKILLIIAAIITVLVILYKKIKAFKTIVQWLLMHLPVFGNVIIYNEVTMFTKTFASLLKHNVFITDSMEILTKVTNNEIYKMLILDTVSNLAHGDKLSLSFKNHWAFPIPAYEMLVTGEQTGQLPEMMSKVSEYYQELHKNAVTRIKTFVEPILIIALTVIVGIIILSIIIPMFSLYESIQA